MDPKRRPIEEGVNEEKKEGNSSTPLSQGGTGPAHTKTQGEEGTNVKTNAPRNCRLGEKWNQTSAIHSRI